MTARLAVSAIYCALALSGAYAQSADTPPDVAAYREAAKETDPEKKIAALEKWKAQFPQSNMFDSADSAIFDTLVTKLPSQQDRIRQFAGGMYRRASAKEKGRTANVIASGLLDANLLLNEAEGYAKKALGDLKFGRYEKEQLARYKESKQDLPSREKLKKSFETSRAARLAVLGRIEMKLGDTKKGKKLLEESQAGNSTNGAVLSELGLIAVKSGNDERALEYLIPAKLSGRATKEAAEAFEAIYRKQHNGSPDGIDAMLDAEYRKRYPNPVTVEPYQPAEKRSDRVVLAEIFTGSGCPPCAGADVAFDAAMERYARKDLAVLMYHVHVPRPDPMTTAQTPDISKAYGVGGVPTYFIDGKKNGGGDSRENAKSVYDRFNPDIEKELTASAEAHITAGVSAKDNTVDVNARVTGVKSESKDLKVVVALVEKELRYNGENGIRFHPMVVRSVQAFELSGEQYRHSFDTAEISKSIKQHLDDYEAKGHRGESFKFSEKKYQIDPNHLAVVIFVHDDKTKHVLQAAFLDLAADTHPPTLEANNAR